MSCPERTDATPDTTYDTFVIGVDEFGDEFEIRCQVTGSNAALSKRWFHKDCELQPMDRSRLFNPQSGAILRLRSPTAI